MANKIGKIWDFIGHYKYLIVVVIGIAVVGVLDENSFIQRVKYEMQISDLKEEIAKYDKTFQSDSRRLKELRNNPKEIEKIAREQYFMKADDEDIFVLSSDMQQTENHETAQ